MPDSPATGYKCHFCGTVHDIPSDRANCNCYESRVERFERDHDPDPYGLHEEDPRE